MEYVAETLEYRGLTIKIIQDEDPESPREWDNCGRMVCWHSRYNLGDGNGKRFVASAEDGTEFPDPDDFREWWKANGKGGILLPLYIYDHSGITMSTGPFSCPWDSGQVGWIFATAEKIREEFGRGKSKRVTKEARERAIKCLEQEVETYDQYLTGDVYGYVIEGDGMEDEVHDSCWGFFGMEDCIAEAKSQADYFADKRDAAKALEARDALVQDQYA